jgi:glutamate N-acetyltransferase / amino-acid N-acetyltransferase
MGCDWQSVELWCGAWEAAFTPKSPLAAVCGSLFNFLLPESDMTGWNLPGGYRYAGIACGIRPDRERRDLALIVSDRPASAAGVFTRNCVSAAPVKLCRERLPRPDARGVVVCSGNANACTGQRGLEDAYRMAAVAADALSCQPEQVLVCSTGVIGKHLPMPAIEKGIASAAGRLSPEEDAFEQAAQSILTTDTRIKVSTARVSLAGQEVHLAGLAKGAAMIGPNLATMLAFILTDAAVGPGDLQAILQKTAEQSFHCISVEGHTSTNDSVILLCNGAGPQLVGEDRARYAEAVTRVGQELARAIAADAEGANHLITIQVEGLRTDAEARRVARAVADSPLVKTAVFGADPNWGRIVSAAGYAGVSFREEELSLRLGDQILYQAGVPQPFDAQAASGYLKGQRDIDIRLCFSLGEGRCTFWTCDLGYEYVRLNAEYTT